MTGIKCPVRNHSAGHPCEVAVYEKNREITYLALDRKSTTLCDFLSDQGVHSGMRTGIVADNSSRYIILIFALLRLGCTVIPINFRFSDRETDNILRGMDVELIIAGKKRKGCGTPARRTLNLDQLFPAAGFQGSVEKRPVLLTGKTLILTSGSTGTPKGVLLSVKNHYFSARGANRNIKLTSGDKWCLTLPLFHVGGLAILFRVFLAGAAVVVPSDRKGITPDTIRSFGITHMSLVQSQLKKLLRGLQRPGIRLPGSLRVVLAGGGAISEPVLSESLLRKVPVYTTYGLSEMGSQVTATSIPVTRQNMNTSGALLEFRELSIGPGGNVLVKGKTLFEGYVSGGKFSPAELNQHGWFDTGDLGYLDTNGMLVISGRGDNMFISGGENMFPEEIEKEILNIPGISEAIVVPVNHPEFGKRPVAFIECSSEETGMLEINKVMKQRLAGFKIPDRFYHFPKTQGGTLKRNRKDLEDAAARRDGLVEVSD